MHHWTENPGRLLAVKRKREENSFTIEEMKKPKTLDNILKSVLKQPK